MGIFQGLFKNIAFRSVAMVMFIVMVIVMFIVMVLVMVIVMGYFRFFSQTGFFSRPVPRVPYSIN